YPFTIKFLIATGSFVLVVMQRRPVHGGEGCIAGSKRGVANVVIYFAVFIDCITYFLQRTTDQQCLEGFFGDGALNWINCNAFARQVGSKSLCRDKRGKRCRKKYAMSHCYSFFWQGDMPGVTGQVQSYLMNGRVSRPTGPVVY